MKRVKCIALLAAFGAVALAPVGCSSNEDTRAPKLGGDAAGKYDINAKPEGRSGGGGAGKAAGGGMAAGASTKN